MIYSKCREYDSHREYDINEQEAQPRSRVEDEEKRSSGRCRTELENQKRTSGVILRFRCGPPSKPTSDHTHIHGRHHVLKIKENEQNQKFYMFRNRPLVLHRIILTLRPETNKRNTPARYEYVNVYMCVYVESASRNMKQQRTTTTTTDYTACPNPTP